MSKKNPTWTRSRVGRTRVHWIAYDDQPGSEDVRTVAQGFALSLVEADAAARAALASEGIYHARRMSKGFGSAPKRDPVQSPQGSSRPAAPDRARPREYLYARHENFDDAPVIAAHLVLKKTALKVYLTRKSCGPDQIGTPDEVWTPNEPKIAIDRARLDRDRAAYLGGPRRPDFYLNRDAAIGNSDSIRQAAYDALKIATPCTLDEIKAAYRLRALAVHPDRGGSPSEFRDVEAAYRQMSREARWPEP